MSGVLLKSAVLLSGLVASVVTGVVSAPAANAQPTGCTPTMVEVPYAGATSHYTFTTRCASGTGNYRAVLLCYTPDPRILGGWRTSVRYGGLVAAGPGTSSTTSCYANIGLGRTAFT